MPKAELVYIETEEELLQWALIHQGYKKPYIMRALWDQNDNEKDPLDECIKWIFYMKEKFPEYYKTEHLCTYIAGVLITLNMEVKKNGPQSFT